ncbi:sensor histidine kinase [Pseudomarimonas salicorniae]|uniref:Histidine kinase n=1 Tax=Pseudomarimonas salicorniae TaxID=2933270 RepID=A0ABT0GC94_9GAMM|nr:histidine kinase [Lysobacter sp. CAU 1642]MCK7592063.1 histidine kinase [Lysobacter sp. CAU 1642]
MRKHGPPIVAVLAVLGLGLELLEQVARCECPAWLDFPGQGQPAGLATIYLGLCYLTFLAMLVSAWWRRATPRSGRSGLLATVARAMDQHNLVVSLGVGLLLLPVFAHTHSIRWVNNLSIALAFALLMFRVVLWVQPRMASAGYAISSTGQRLYIAYAVLILLLIGLAPTVDDRDPLGTRFQLHVLIALLALHLAYTWVSGQLRLLRQLRSERAHAELSLLKSQVAPHFLFNSLNNLYGLAREKSDRAPELILRLSDLLRHSVYQGSRARVPLEDEIEHLEGYVALQEIRHARPVRVDLDVRLDERQGEGGTEVAGAGYLIAPMLLIVLLENAYKHGVDSVAGDAYIDLQLHVQSGRLCLRIRNNFEPAGQPSAHSGLGLANLRRRLELEYPGRHRFEQRSEAGHFEVWLELPLDTAVEDEAA